MVSKNMNSKFVIVMIGTWFLFMVLAIINASLRNEIYKPFLGEIRAHQLSTVIFIAMILITSYLVLRISNVQLNTQDAFIMGTIWLLLTICFEFLAGHYIFGNSWDKLLADYNILKGRIWSFVLVTLFFSPYFTNKFL
jgi:hypothetical protein